jgi:hypothetical protein
MSAASLSTYTWQPFDSSRPPIILVTERIEFSVERAEEDHRILKLGSRHGGELDLHACRDLILIIERRPQPDDRSRAGRRRNWQMSASPPRISHEWLMTRAAEIEYHCDFTWCPSFHPSAMAAHGYTDSQMMSSISMCVCIHGDPILPGWHQLSRPSHPSIRSPRTNKNIFICRSCP